MLIDRDPNSLIYCGAPEQNYRILLGQEAEERFRLLQKKLTTEGEDITISSALPAWARALHLVKNTPKEISDLLAEK